jgi:hypothetical protein
MKAMTHDDILKAIEKLISSRSGHMVCIDGLSVFRLDKPNDDGQYTVSLENDEGELIDEKFFKTPMLAAMFFEAQRSHLRLGMQFEKGKGS